MFFVFFWLLSGKSKYNILPSRYDGLKNDEGYLLIKKIKYNAVYSKAIEQVFNKVIIGRDLETCNRLARDYEATCVTLQGWFVCKVVQKKRKK